MFVPRSPPILLYPSVTLFVSLYLMKRNCAPKHFVGQRLLLIPIILDDEKLVINTCEKESSAPVTNWLLYCGHFLKIKIFYEDLFWILFSDSFSRNKLNHVFSQIVLFIIHLLALLSW